MRDFESEMFAEVMEAVFAEDLARARQALDELHRGAGDRMAEAVRQAKQRACGRVRGATELPEPFILPMPGHKPGTYGLPTIERTKPIKARRI